MEIRWKLHCQVVVTHVPTQAMEVEEKEELKGCESGVNSPFVIGRWRNFHMKNKK